MSRKIILDSVDSTMTEAARRAPDLEEPTWIMARHQSAAKGRQGRNWAMGAGNFAATLVTEVEVREAALRSFAASLALRTALDRLGVEGLALKWPNDVLVRGGKAAGILLEMLPGNRLAIGFGVNLRHAPDASDVEDGAVRPVALDLDVRPEDFLDVLAESYDIWEATFQREGFGPLREVWLSHAARLGEPIRARTVREEHYGTFETIDNDGRLVLSTPQGTVTVAAADVFF
ncbi:MAG: biotin--[acetyl-CoA-carboxylase] ligase [Pseudomonadota bacterium]